MKLKKKKKKTIYKTVLINKGDIFKDTEWTF